MTDGGCSQQWVMSRATMTAAMDWEQRQHGAAYVGVLTNCPYTIGVAVTLGGKTCPEWIALLVSVTQPTSAPL